MKMVRIERLVPLMILLNSVMSIDYDGWLNLKMEHSLNCNNEKYCSRGSVSLKSIRSGIAVVEQTGLSIGDVDQLKGLAEFDGFYTIRTIVTSADNRKSEFLSSVKAQLFLESGLTDHINAWILPTGAVAAINFQVQNGSLPLKKEGNMYKINSKFFIHYVEQGPVPDTATYVQKLEREREAREKGEVKDNRSFIAKYWMYIVPLAIFVMISGAANPEAQGSR